MKSSSFITRVSKHSGAIKALQFNSFRRELLASAGAKGELFITDLTNPSNAFRLGSSAARADDFDAMDWNKKVPHIMATGSSAGFATVWDLKAKKESLTLNNMGRKAISAVAWDPDEPTTLATAIPNDQDPLILVWDLRNSNAPKKTLRAHDQGVLSISWCIHDSELLLSCGKDNRTICWNPRTERVLGELPIVTNWTFETRWCPQNPNLLATASFDGKISIHTIQNTKAGTDIGTPSVAQSVDGEDFFSKAQIQPQGTAFSLPKAPKWLARPVSASFGFGGKLVRVCPDKSSGKDSAQAKSTVSISTFSVDSSIGDATQKFENSLENKDLRGICDTKISEAKTDEEQADWKVIQTLISDNPRKQLIEYLGFKKTDPSSEKPDSNADGKVSEPNGTLSKDASSFFDDAGIGESFLSDLASTKGAKTNNPFKVYTGSESEADKKITHALMLGSFDNALAVCLKENRLSDAFMIAICGGGECIEKVQKAYFNRKSEGPNYLRLLASIVGKNLWDMVYNADLADWKDVMATLCTFANESEFSDLCEALGDRLEESIPEESSNKSMRKDASFCYLAGSKLEKIVLNWVQELEEMEKTSLQEAEDDTSFSVHAKVLQNFIEKVTIFRRITNFKDTGAQQASEKYKLAPLYAKYTEYADILAAHGQLLTAQKYLELLPAQYSDANVARNRVQHALKKATTSQSTRGEAPAARPNQRTQPVMPYQPVKTSAMPNRNQSPSPYVPAAVAAPVHNASPYGFPSSNYQPPSQPLQPPGMVPQPPRIGGGYQPAAYTGGPGQSLNNATINPPPSRTANVGNWNDIPDLGGKPSSRRGTPGPGTVNSPFPNQPNHGQPESVSAPGMAPAHNSGQPFTSPPLPPPPKGPPRMSSPPSIPTPSMPNPSQPPQQEQRRPSAAAAAYAPTQPSPQPTMSMAPSIARGQSPYNPPPSNAPPPSRYAPAPNTQNIPTAASSGAFPPPMASNRPAPAPNPYVNQGSNFGQPDQRSLQPHPSGPPQGPPGGSFQQTPANQMASRPGTSQSQRTATPVAPKYRKSVPVV